MLLYCTSMDHYGAGSAVAYRNSDDDMGWDFTSDTTNVFILGDGFTNSPVGPSGNDTDVDGTWRVQAPPWGARRGDRALMADSPRVKNQTVGGETYSIGSASSMRMSIPGTTKVERIIHVAFSISSLPADSVAGKGHIVQFLDSFGNIRGRLAVNASGRLVIYDGAAITFNNTGNLTSDANVLVVSAAPVIAPETWYSLSIKITSNALNSNVDIEIYNGDIIPANLVMNQAGVALTGTGFNNIDALGWLPATGSGKATSGVTIDTSIRYVRDIVLCDDTGTYNNDHLGQVFVGAQQMRAEDSPGSGWDVQPREKIGDGIGSFIDGSGLYAADNANLELGSGDFTIEGFWKLDQRNIAPDTTILAGKWDEANDARSWKLEFDDGSSTMKFIISTDGVAETTVWEYPFIPELQRYYHIAVDRASSVTRVFVDGVQKGMDQADSNTYHDGAAVLGIMARYDGTTIDADTAAVGWLDEFRLTVGASRYTSDFTPTAVPFGRDVGGDASFANVELLIGFDDSITDESSNAFTLVAGSGVAAQEPDDGDNTYEVLNQRPAWDDSYIEARNTFAYNVLQFDANPADTETVTLGSTTYTFKTALSSGPTVANEVHIGPTARDTMEHLVAAVNGGDGIGTDYSTGTTANTDIFAEQLPDEQGLFTATTIGTAGNTEPSTETLASGAFLFGATLDFGEDIPSPSDFAIERLPVDVTGVLGVQVTARGYKSDAGTANLRFDLKGPGATVDTGTAQGTDLNPSWLRQIFEEDPDTSVGITPSTIVGGRVRVTRTT